MKLRSGLHLLVLFLAFFDLLQKDHLFLLLFLIPVKEVAVVYHGFAQNVNHSKALRPLTRMWVSVIDGVLLFDFNDRLKIVFL